MQRQNLLADDPWDVESADFRSRVFWRPDDARMGATLYELGPGYDGDRVHMHYGAEEMFFVLSGRIVVRNLRARRSSVPATSFSARRELPDCTPSATRTTSRPGFSP